ncbi:Ppp1r7 [Symbiodinium microadriaticum]|nr:Ppp1r7 [Symbiodinium microadriaticum]
MSQGYVPPGQFEDLLNLIRQASAASERAMNAAKYAEMAASAAGAAGQQAVVRAMHMANAPGAPTAAPFSPGAPDPGVDLTRRNHYRAAMDVDSGAEGPNVEEVPPPPLPPAGPSARRTRVQLPDHDHDDGPTYYRLGIDYPIDADDDEVLHQCARIKKLENLEAVGKKLRKLCLVANCVEKIENLETNTNLEHLELYQNMVKKIENISHLRNLTVLDLSFNKIRSTEPLAACPFEYLENLYLSSNKIVDVEGIFHFTQLKMLELGSNRIRAIPEQVSSLVNLKELWLGKNKITSMSLPALPALRHLSLQNNRLESWEPSFFRNLAGLTHLYLGHNNLPDLPDEFALLADLVEVDLVRNAITQIKPIPELQKLQELWMNDNKIEDLAQIANLASFPSLKTIYLERNPMQDLGNKQAEERYREAILQAVPYIEQLDAERLNIELKVISDGTERQVMGIRRA